MICTKYEGVLTSSAQNMREFYGFDCSRNDMGIENIK